MLKQACLTLTICTTVLAVAQPSYASNIVSLPILFTSNDSSLPQTSGDLEYDISNSWLYNGNQAFEITSFNFQSPLGTNYSLAGIIDEYFFDVSIPSYIPSTQDFLFLNFDFVYPDNDPELEPQLELVGGSGFWLQKPGGETFVEGISLGGNEYRESSILISNEHINDEGSYRVVPEPITLLGVGTAISFGAAFKRKIAKK